MKKIWLVGLVILIAGLWDNPSFAGGYKPGSEPDGFRGIKWGTDISALPNMKKVYASFARNHWDIFRTCFKHFTLEERRPIIWYIKEGEKLKIGGAKLIQILYGFRKGKFYCVYISPDIHSWGALENAIFEKFGSGSGGYFRHGWNGNITLMKLTSSPTFDFIMKSTRIYNQIKVEESEQKRQKEIERKREAKEGAETGF